MAMFEPKQGMADRKLMFPFKLHLLFMNELPKRYWSGKSSAAEQEVTP
jgi:hypothetical protein